MASRQPLRALLPLAIGAIALLVLLGWLLRARSGSATAPEPPAAAHEERAAPAELAGAGGLVDRRDVQIPVQVDPPAEPSPAAGAAPPDARPPKDARGTLALTVLDAATGAPVPQARVTFIGMRREDAPGSEYVWPGEAPAGETDVRGVARLEFPAWVHGLALTRQLDTSVSHPEYVAFRGDLTVESLEQDATVRLERGAFVIVSGWIGSRAQVVRDVQLRCEDEAGLDAGSWQPMRDGRPSTTRLAPGAHALAIAWTDAKGATWHSKVEPFTLLAGEQRELALELLPPATLEGRLDPAVPRPVVGGEVELAIEFGERNGPTALRTWKAQVAADGSFRFQGLPSGRGELIAQCDGWVSRRELTRIEQPGGSTWLGRSNPGLVVPSSEPFVVPMEPAAALVVRVRDGEGRPLEGAAVDVWPNVSWRNGYSSIFLDRSWSARSDPGGVARLENLPPEEGQGLAVRLAGWRIVGASGPHAEQLEVGLTAGETATLDVVLERAGG